MMNNNHYFIKKRQTLLKSSFSSSNGYRQFIRKIALMSLMAVIVVVCFANEDMLRDISETNRAHRKQVYDQIIRFINDNPDFYRIDEQYYMLAELSTGLYLNEPEVPLGYYRKVLELNPNFPDKDLVLYNVGFYSTELAKKERDSLRRALIDRSLRSEKREVIDRWGDEYRLNEEKMEEAINAYREILLDYPASQFYSETLYRLASIYYEIGLDADEPKTYYEKAKGLFHTLAARDNDPYQYLGLYQRAWTYYSTNQFENAIKDFSDILNVATSIPEHRAYFEEDAISNIAYSLNNLDDYKVSSRSAIYVKNTLVNLVKNENNIIRIIGRVADIKLDINVPFHAVDYYNTYLGLFPLHKDNPIIVDSIATVYASYNYMLEPGQDWNEYYINQKMKLITSYDSESEWFRANSEKNIDKQLATIRGAFRFMQGRMLNRYVNHKDYENLEGYEDFVRKYDVHPAFNDESDFNWVKDRQKEILTAYEELAMSLETIDANYKAWKQYAYYNERYPENDDFIANESDRYYFFDAFFRAALTVEPVNNLIVITELDEEFTKEELNDLFIVETDRYLSIFTSAEHYTDEYSDGIIKALYSRSLIFMERDEQTAAEKDLIDILQYKVDQSMKRDIYVHLAQINEGFRNYAKAEEYYKNAAQYAHDEEEKEQILTNSRAQIEKMASHLASESSFVDAALEYLRLAEELKETDKEMYIGYKNKAVDAYVKAGEYQEAIDVLMSLNEVLTGIEESFALYSNAWGIADTLMTNEPLMERLQLEYIDLYPASNRAYQIRNVMIAKLIDNPNKKMEAADKFLDLHEEVAAEKIDAGGDRAVDIYFDAVSLLADTTAIGYDEDYLISKMLDFENIYPDDPRSNDLLEIVWDKYDKRGLEESRDELARYIFKKDPNSQLYVNVANRELGKIYSAATQLLEDEQYEDMLVKIEEFKALHQKYKSENVVLNLDDAYLDFEDWNRYYEQLQAYDKFLVDIKADLDKIETNFIKKSPNELFRANAQTKLMEHILPRLDGMVKTTDNQITEISKVLEKVKAFEPESVKTLPFELDTRAIYLMGKVYDYAMYVVDVQMDRFLNVSTEMREIKEEDEDEYNNFIATQLNPKKDSYVIHFKKQSAAFYNDLWQISITSQYTDEYIELAKGRLSDWGLMTESLSLYSNADWLAIRTSKLIENIDSFNWTSVVINPRYIDANSVVGMENTDARPIWLKEDSFQDPDLDSQEAEDVYDDISSQEVEPAYFLKTVLVEGEVVEAYLKFAAYDESSVWINGEEVATDLVAYIDEEDQGTTYAQTIAIDSSVFLQGENTVLIKSGAKSNSPGILFNLELVISK